MHHWTQSAQTTIEKCAREARMSAEEGRNQAWMHEPSAWWVTQWEEKMKWHAATAAGIDPASDKIENREDYRIACEAIQKIQTDATKTMEQSLVKVAGSRWMKTIEKGIEAIKGTNKRAAKHRWRTCDIACLARLDEDTREKVLQQAPWLAEHAIAIPEVRNKPVKEWAARAAAHQYGEKQRTNPQTLERAKSMLRGWKTHDREPPLRLVWECAKQELQIGSDGQWAQAILSTLKNETNEEGVKAIRNSGNLAEALRKKIGLEAVTTIAKFNGNSTAQAEHRLKAIERAWEKIPALKLARRNAHIRLEWKTSWAPLWWVPYTCAAAAIAGAHFGTYRGGTEKKSDLEWNQATRKYTQAQDWKNNTVAEIERWSGLLISLDQEGIVRKRTRRNILEDERNARAYNVREALKAYS